MELASAKKQIVEHNCTNIHPEIVALPRDPGRLLEVGGNEIIFEEGRMGFDNRILQPVNAYKIMSNPERLQTQTQWRRISLLPDGRICEVAEPQGGVITNEHANALWLGMPGEELRRLPDFLGLGHDSPLLFMASGEPSKIILGRKTKESKERISLVNLDTQHEDEILFEGLYYTGCDMFNPQYGIFMYPDGKRLGGGIGFQYDIFLKRKTGGEQVIPFGTGGELPPYGLSVGKDYVVFWHWQNANFIMLDLKTWPVTVKYRFSLWRLRTMEDRPRRLVSGCQIGENAFAFLESSGTLLIVQESARQIDVSRYELETKEKANLDPYQAGEIGVSLEKRKLYVKFGSLYNIPLDLLLIKDGGKKDASPNPAPPDK
jgi:hypothetical protein